MKKMRIWFPVFLCTALMLAGCGTAYLGSSMEQESSSYAAAEEAAYSDDAYPEEAVWEEDVMYEEAAESGMSVVAQAAERKEAPAELTADKLVYTCNMDIETTEYETTVDAIQTLIGDYEGIVEYESEFDDDQYWFYEGHQKTSGTMRLNLNIRIPSERYAAFVSALEEVGKVTSKSQNVENISRQYHETEAQIEALSIEQDRLLDMMEKAETIEEMILIEERLTSVESELSSYKTYLASMDVDVRYSTVNLNVREVLQYSEDTPSPITFGQRMRENVKGSWKGFLEFWEAILTIVIYLLPFLMLAAIILIVVFFIRRKLDPRTPEERKADRAAKKQARKEEKMAKLRRKTEQKQMKKQAKMRGATDTSYAGDPRLHQGSEETKNDSPK